MAANAQNIALLRTLEAQKVFKLRGFTASVGPAGSVVIDRWGHMRGLWHFNKGQYFWTGGASSQPTLSKETLDEAVNHTLTTIAGA